MKSFSWFKIQKVLILIFLGLVAALPCEGQNGDSSVALFKKFIESPPSIEEMLVRYKNLENTNSTSQYYLIRYQTNGFELKQVNSFEDLSLPKTGHPRFFLKYENKWLYMDSHQKLRYWMDD